MNMTVPSGGVSPAQGKQPDERAKQVCLRFEDMKAVRNGLWDSLFQSCKDVVWPNTEDFQRNRSPGQPLTELCYDSTALWANTQFANVMHSVVANPFERWFNIMPDTDDADILEDEEVLAWAESESDGIYQDYNHFRSNHKQSLHEDFMSKGAFGNGVVFQEWDAEYKIPVFMACPLSQCYFKEDHKGFVDTLYREYTMTYRQLVEKFGFESLPANLVGKAVTDLDKIFTIVHAVEPRQDRRPNSPLAADMPYSSDWVLTEKKVTLRSSGYETFPYHVGRWEKISGQVYGRGPAMTALPTIKVLNQMKKAILQAAQKVVNPPMILPHDSFMSDFDMTPGALNFYEATGGMGPDVIRPLITGANPQLGQDMMQPEKDFVIQCFYADMMSVPFKKERQTELEMQVRQDEILRSIAPLIGRQEAELLGPMLARTYQLRLKYGKTKPFPAKLKGVKLKVVYTSRAAFAQKGGKLMSMVKYLTQTIFPMIQVAPEIKDTIDFDQVAKQSAMLADVTRKIFRSPEDVTMIRKGRADQQQAQQQQAQMESASNAVKNVAQAGAALPETAGAGLS